jgi:hypothetical protein
MTLSPGERIELKKRIATALSEQSWADIDLTLGEFGLSTLEEWDGSKESYVRAMLQGASEPLMLQLYGYLNPSDAPVVGPPTTTFENPSDAWTGAGLRLFVSHCHAYADQAGKLRSELAKRSIDAFVAHDSIEPTEEWEQVILSALKSCDACAALMTPEFSNSAWCDQEVGFCVARDKLVIPLEFGAVPYGFVGRYQALPIRAGEKMRDVSLSIFELLVRKPQSRNAMARALVSRWANTGSWDAARENYGFLKAIPPEAWTQQLVDDVWEARDRVHDLRTADISWKSSEAAIEQLFDGLPYDRPNADERPS